MKTEKAKNQTYRFYFYKKKAPNIITIMSSVFNNFQGPGTRLNNILSNFDRNDINELKQNVESHLNELRHANNNSFSYNYPATQHVKYLSFNIISGSITSNEMASIQREFPGSETRTRTGGSGQVLLIQKELASNYSDVVTSTLNTKYSKPRLILEIVIYLFLLLITLISFVYPIF